MLAGFIYPLESVPRALQIISYAFPTRYFMTITRTIFLKGGGLDVLWPQFAALAVFSVLLVFASALAYKERV
jgi:ABC-2 type transport system permease protein